MRQYKLKKCKRVHGIHFTPDSARLLAVGGEEVRMVDCAVWLDLATGENLGRIEQFANCCAVDLALTRYVLGGTDQWRGNLEKYTTPLQWCSLADGDLGENWLTFQSRTRNAARFHEVAGLAIDPTGARLAISHAAPSGKRSNPNELMNYLTVLSFDSAGERIDFDASDWTRTIVFNADATRIATTGGIDHEPIATVYDLATRTRVFAFDAPATVTRGVQFLLDNRLIVANGNNVYILPPEGGEPLLTLTGHPKQVNAVTLTPDGQRLLTASHDGSIRVWDANTGEPGPAFDWQIGPVTAVAFAPDGLTCAAAGLNGKVVVWDVDA